MLRAPATCHPPSLKQPPPHPLKDILGLWGAGFGFKNFSSPSPPVRLPIVGLRVVLVPEFLCALSDSKNASMGGCGAFQTLWLSPQISQMMPLASQVGCHQLQQCAQFGQPGMAVLTVPVQLSRASH